MIIDMHYHIDKLMEPMDRLLSRMEQHGIDRIALIMHESTATKI